MSLPLRPPYAPMEARVVDEIPSGPGWQYEPKWDGFRCLAFRDGERIELQSKNGQPLARYFPEVVAHLRSLSATTFVLDGELVVPVDGQLSFDDLLQRIHPAASRIERLARERPAVLIVFDLLVDASGRSLVDRPLGERRKQLEAFAAKQLAGRDDLRLSPATEEPVRPARGSTSPAPLSTASWPSGSTCRTRRASGPACRRSSGAAPPTAWWAASATPPSHAPSGRCCWVSTTPTACSITWGSPPALRPRPAPRSWPGSGRSSRSRASPDGRPAGRAGGAPSARANGRRWPRA